MMEVKNKYKMTKLGEIPVEWEVKRLSEITSINPENISSDTPENFAIKYIDIESVNNRRISGFKQLNFKDAPSRAKRIIKENDIILSTVRPYLTAFAKVNIKDENLICSTGFAVIRVDKYIDSEFIYQFIFNDLFLNQLLRQMRGSNYPAVNSSDVSDALCIVPHLKEQQKIAEILSTVDEQIEQTDQLIEKTKELKKGLMQQLLTKGIGHTKFKKSELGEIPVEWKVKKLEEIMFSKGEGMRRGPFGGALKKEIFVEEGIAVYEQKHVIHEKINRFRYFITKEKYNEMKAFNVKPDDILISCSGTIGCVLLVPEDAKEGIINQALLRLRPNDYMNIQFVKHLLKSDFVQNSILDTTHGSTLKNMASMSVIKKIKLRIPKIEEQQKIAEIFNLVDENIEEYEQEKSKYEELKKGLMQQLLTGKTRVKVD